MRNRSGFVPKNSPIQPDYYSCIFNGWTAVFICEDNTELHLSMIPDYSYGEKVTADYAKGLEVLKQGKDSRIPLRPEPVKTIKKGLEIIASLMEKHTC